jgi:hypothetical protein
LGSAKNFDILTSVKQISIIIPVNVIYGRVISKLDKGSLRAKFVKDYNCLEERVVYIIGGREIEIKTPASVFATVGISFPLDSVDHVTETKKLKK